MKLTFPQPVAVIERARRYLAKMPRSISGSGGHSALWAAALALVKGFSLSPEEAMPLLLEWNAECEPMWSHSELAHKLNDVARTQIPDGYLLNTNGANPSAGSASSGKPTLAYTKPEPKWPEPDYDLIREIIRTGYTVLQLREASPVPAGELSVQDVLPLMFPGDPLLTVGKNDREFFTAHLSEILPTAQAQSFIVPSACTAREGLTQSGTPSQHCKSIVGPRQYLVLETDFKAEGQAGELLAYARSERGLYPLDVAASVLKYFTTFLPTLALVVHSAGKSLHGFFNVADLSASNEPDGNAALFEFMQSARLGGCDHAGWTRCQFARMPGGTRRDKDGSNPRQQRILYFNPQQTLTHAPN